SAPSWSAGPKRISSADRTTPASGRAPRAVLEDLLPDLLGQLRLERRREDGHAVGGATDADVPRVDHELRAVHRRAVAIEIAQGWSRSDVPIEVEDRIALGLHQHLLL